MHCRCRSTPWYSASRTAPSSPSASLPPMPAHCRQSCSPGSTSRSTVRPSSLLWSAMNAEGRNRPERRLAAILAADVAGYSRLIGADEEGTLDRLRSIRTEVIDPAIAAHRGRLVKTTGDGLLAEFSSAVDALRCATEAQRALAGRNTGIAEAERIELRIGIHQGDIVAEDGDIFGDGVNVAARLEALADPGGICVSARVQEDTTGRLDLAFTD